MISPFGGWLRNGVGRGGASALEPRQGDAPHQLALGEPQYSKTKIKEDEFFGRMAVFYHEATATLPVSGPTTTTARTKLYVRYQGCADVGVCYPPIAKTFDVNLSGGASTSVRSGTVLLISILFERGVEV